MRDILRGLGRGVIREGLVAPSGVLTTTAAVVTCMHTRRDVVSLVIPGLHQCDVMLHGALHGGIFKDRDDSFFIINCFSFGFVLNELLNH